MKKWAAGLMPAAAVVILSGCGLNPFASGDETPEGVDTEIREKYYEDFVAMYETYEGNVKKHDGSFIDENGEYYNFEEGVFGDQGNIIDDATTDAMEENEGEDAILSEAEDELYSDLHTASFLRGFDAMTEELKQRFWDNNTEFEEGNVQQALIDVESDIINTLDLDRESIELVRAQEEEAVAQEEAEEEAKQEQEKQARAEKEAEEAQEQAAQETAEAPSNADIEGEVSQNNNNSEDVNYDPDYMGDREWNSCQDAYSMNECISYDQSYAYGDGREEIMSADDPDGYVMDTYDRAKQEWENDTGNYEQAYEAGKAVVKDFYSDRNEINELSFEAFETLRVEEIFRDDDGNIIINSAVGLQTGLDEEVEYVPYRVEMTEELEYHYLYMPDDHYYEELTGSY